MLRSLAVTSVVAADRGGPIDRAVRAARTWIRGAARGTTGSSRPVESSPIGGTPSRRAFSAAIAALVAAGLLACGSSAYVYAKALAGQALLHVEEVMRGGDEVPQVKSGATIRQALVEMTRGRIGMTAVVDAAGRIKGVFTDGDLRRTLQKSNDLERRVDDVMTASPKTVRREMLAAEAVHVMEETKINQLLVVDAQGALVGALNMHDLFRAKVI